MGAEIVAQRGTFMAGKRQVREVKHSKRTRRHPDEIFIYGRLLLLNLHARAIGEVIKGLARAGAVLKNEAAYFGSMVEEARAFLSQNVVETMDAREVHLSAVISRRRLAIEKKLIQSDE